MFAVWAIAYFGHFFYFESMQIFWLLISRDKSYLFILTEMGWATFWAFCFANQSCHPT
jgi:hypothetical protein